MTDALSVTLAALADPTRRAIVARLALGSASATELGEPFALSQPAISKHLKVLEKAGLISRGRSAQFRPCRLEPAALQPVASWVAEVRSQFEAQLDRLEDYLETIQTTQRRSRGSKKNAILKGK